MVHSVLPEPLADAAAPVLEAAGIGLRRHASVMAGAEAAAADPSALALLGPLRSRDVCFAVEATAPAGVPLIAPVATWAGVTRTDEPGCEEDPADHRGTLLRMVARDTEVAARIAADLRASGRGARVVAGDHEYGVQLEGQLRLAGVPDGDDVIVLAGLPGEPEIESVRALAGVPVIAFDGVQGEDLGDREVLMALPFAPIEGVAFDHVVYVARSGASPPPRGIARTKLLSRHLASVS